MKVRVIKQFNDKHTGKLNRIGEEMDISIERINEILKVGGFIELVEQTEQTEEPEQKQEEAEPEPKDVQEAQPKTTGGRKRSK